MYGACAHGLGLLREAVIGYERVLKTNPAHVVFYLREMALLQHRLLDAPLASYNLDHVMTPGEANN